MAYEADFIDDTELERYKEGEGAKTRFSGFYVNRVRPPSAQPAAARPVCAAVAGDCVWL